MSSDRQQGVEESVKVTVRELFDAADKFTNIARKRKELKPMVDILTAHSPADALMLLRGLPEGKTREACYFLLGGACAEEYLNVLLKSDLSDTERRSVEQGVNVRLYDQDGNGALVIALRLGKQLTPEGVRALMQTAGTRFTDSISAETASEKLPQEWRCDFRGGVVSSLAQKTEKVSVAVELLSKLKVDEVPAESYTTVASYYGKTAPQSAIEWAAGLPESRRGEALSCAAMVWAQTNENELANYANSLGDGLIKDYCATALALHLKFTGQPAESLEWTKVIKSPALKDRLR